MEQVNNMGGRTKPTWKIAYSNLKREETRKKSALRWREIYKQGEHSAARQIRIKKASKHKRIGWVDDYWPSFDEWELARSPGLKEYLRDTEWPAHVLTDPLSYRPGVGHVWFYLRECEREGIEP